MSRTSAAGTVFMERRKSITNPEESKLAVIEAESLPPSISPRPQKRPGRAARLPVAAQNKSIPPPSTSEIRLPSGLLMPWDVDSKQLAAEMQAYTLEEIGRSIAESEAENPKIPEPQRQSPKSKFKPKKPALRYHERHPEEVLSKGSKMDVDESRAYEEDMDDDTEYIVDTYIRMPAHEVKAEGEQYFGLLVLDSQIDIDEFYKEGEEQEEEEIDEEDENAEDHYTADYPDEEESESEYDFKAYSDDEGDSMRHPWTAKEPAWLKDGKKGDESDDDDGEYK